MAAAANVAVTTINATAANMAAATNKAAEPAMNVAAAICGGRCKEGGGSDCNDDIKCGDNKCGE